MEEENQQSETASGVAFAWKATNNVKKADRKMGIILRVLVI